MRSVTIWVQHVTGDTYTVWLGNDRLCEVTASSFKGAVKEVERRALRGVLGHPSVERKQMVDLRAPDRADA